MNKKSLTIGTVALASTLLLAACGSSSSSSSSSNGKLASKQVINLMENSDLPSMDASKATDHVSFDMLSNVQEGLYRIGKDSKIEPGIATATKVSKDGKTYTFTLRKNAKWSNGDKVTAHDFVYGWQRTVNPKTASQYAYLYSGIKNADKITNGKAKATTLGIKADGNYKLTVSLEKPISYFKLLMGFASFFPQDQKVVNKYGSKFASNATDNVYNGPYKLTGWNGTNNTWALAKNSSYWDQKNVKLSKINFQSVKDPNTSLNLFNSKKLDDALLNGTQVKNYKHNSAYVLRKEASTFYLEMNQRNKKTDVAKAFRNEDVRKALALSVDKKQLVNDVLADGSVAAKGYVSAGLAKNPKTGKDFADDAYVAGAVQYDQAQAKKLMAKGLKEAGLKKLNFTLLADDTDNGKKTTEFLQGAYQKMPNVKVTVKNVPFKVRLTDSQKGNFDMVVSGWNADFSDPISFLALFTSSNSYNNGRWSSSTFDSEVKKANGTDANNTSARWTDMVKAEKNLMNTQGVVPLYQQSQSYLQNQKIKGLIYNQAGVNWNYKDAYLAK